MDSITSLFIAIVHNCPEPHQGCFEQHCVTWDGENDEDVHIPVRLLIGVYEGDEVAYCGKVYTAKQRVYGNSPFSTFDNAMGCQLEKAERLFAPLVEKGPKYIAKYETVTAALESWKAIRRSSKAMTALNQEAA